MDIHASKKDNLLGELRYTTSHIAQSPHSTYVYVFF